MPGYELCPSPRIPSCLPSKAHFLRGALLDHSGYIAAPSQTFGTPTSSDIHLDMWTSQYVLWLHLDHSARLDTPIGYKSNRLPSSAPPLSYTKHRTLHAVSPQKWIMTQCVRDARGCPSRLLPNTLRAQKFVCSSEEQAQAPSQRGW